MTAGTQGATPPPLRRNRNYILWFIGHTFTDLGASLTSIALPLLILALTGSTEFAGTLAALTSAVSTLMLTPAGVIADTFDRRRLVMVAVPIAATAYGALAWLSWADAVTIPLIVVLVLVGTIAGSLISASKGAMMRVLAPDEQFPTIVSAEQGRSAAIELGGGPLGGLLFSIQQALPFAARAVGYVVAFFTVLGMKADFHPSRAQAESASEESSFWQRTGEGFRVMASTRGVVPTAIAAAFVNVAINAYVMTLIYSWYQDGIAPWIIGLITTGFFAGILMGTLIAPRLVKRFATGRLSIVAFGLACVALVPLVLSMPPAVVLAGLMVAAVSFPAVNAGLGGYQVAAVQNKHQGRMQAAINLISMVLMPLAPLLAGFGLGLWGTATTALIIAILAVIGPVILASSPAARGVPTPDKWGAYAGLDGE